MCLRATITTCVSHDALKGSTSTFMSYHTIHFDLLTSIKPQKRTKLYTKSSRVKIVLNNPLIFFTLFARGVIWALAKFIRLCSSSISYPHPFIILDDNNFMILMSKIMDL